MLLQWAIFVLPILSTCIQFQGNFLKNPTRGLKITQIQDGVATLFTEIFRYSHRIANYTMFTLRSKSKYDFTAECLEYNESQYMCHVEIQLILIDLNVKKYINASIFKNGTVEDFSMGMQEETRLAFILSGFLFQVLVHANASSYGYITKCHDFGAHNITIRVFKYYYFESEIFEYLNDVINAILFK